MKRIRNIASLLFITISVCLNGQVAGEWTWMNSSNVPNFTGVYGTKGVFSPTNKPPAVYEACEWTDNQGNFWFFGGSFYNVFSGDLWKYNVQLNQWAWMNGPGGTTNHKPFFGVQHIANPNNTPGFRTMSYTWKDNGGNLWLYGGAGYFNTSGGGVARADLWKYNIVTGMWSWEKGDTIPLQSANYGVKGVETSSNTPGGIFEVGVSWTANNGDLWLMDLNGCMWRYRISTGNWTWMKGNQSGQPFYGPKNANNPNTTPGIASFAYTRWKDSQGYFWYCDTYNGNCVFKFDVNTTNWTYVWGDSIINWNNLYKDYCDYHDTEPDTERVKPYFRGESRACWIDLCDNLWLYGGAGFINNVNTDLNDLIYFDIVKKVWVRASNDTVYVANSTFGIQGVSSPSNKPSSRSGANPFRDANGNLWFYGGYKDPQNQHSAELWRYQMSNGCPPCLSTVTAVYVNNKADDLVIFPNPTNSNIRVTNLPGNTEVIIIDSKGNTLYKEKIVENNFEYYFKEGGIYFVRFSDGKKFYKYKVLVK